MLLLTALTVMSSSHSRAERSASVREEVEGAQRGRCGRRLPSCGVGCGGRGGVLSNSNVPIRCSPRTIALTPSECSGDRPAFNRSGVGLAMHREPFKARAKVAPCLHH